MFIRKVKKFFTLPLREQWLFLEAFFLTGVVRLAILLLPFRWLVPILGNQTRGIPTEEDAIKIETARRIGVVVEIVSRYTPWESKCLVQACVCKLMLRRREINNILYLGVRKDGSNGLVAHAWLQCGQIVVNGGYSLELFTIVGQFVDDREYERR